MLSRYRIVEKLGAGGMGAVYRAEDTTLQRMVAIKILSSELLSRPETRARFLQEARVAASLNHPSICTVHEVDEVGPDEAIDLPGGGHLTAGTPYIAMELIEGRTLDRILARGDSLPLPELLRLTIQIAEGLAAAHTKGIVHRDLKPQNVMVMNDGRLKILDFGLAKQVTPLSSSIDDETRTVEASPDLTDPGIVVGTVSYMSPEQAMGRAVDSRSDIFAFGTMLYEMASGKRPFRGETRTSTLARILEREPEPLLDLREDLPFQLGRIVHRCLKKKPEERYHDTRDLVAALRDLLDETTSDRLRPSLPAETSTKQTTRPWLWPILGAVLIGAIGSAIWFGGRGRPEIDRTPIYRQITFSGTAIAASVSPDGQFLAYASWEDDAGVRLVVRDLVGGEEIDLYKGETFQRGFNWSPDGSRILFDESDISGIIGWRSVSRLGGEPRRLPVPPWSHALWSADGRQIIGWHETGKRLLFYDLESGDTTSIALRGDFTDLFHCRLHRSPLPGLLAFSARDTASIREIWTVTTDGSEQHLVVADSLTIGAFAFSPDGEAIYYFGHGSKAISLKKVVIEPQSGRPIGDPVELFSGMDLGGVLSFSPDGRRLFCIRSRGASNLWQVHPPINTTDSVGVAMQLTRGTSQTGDPRISPDGKSVVYAKRQGQGRRIYTMPIDGGPEKQLTFGDVIHAAPDWSPDGSEICYCNIIGDRKEIWRVPSTGGSPQRIAPVDICIGNALTWAPGRRIAYRRADVRGYRLLDPSSGEIESVPGDPDSSETYHGYPQYSHDGRHLAITLIDWGSDGSEDPGLWIFTPDTGERRRLIREWVWALGWSVDDRYLYLVRFAPRRTIFRMPVDGGEEEWILNFPPEVGAMGCASADGQKFVFTGAEIFRDVWQIENFDPSSE